MSLLTKMHRDT